MNVRRWMDLVSFVDKKKANVFRPIYMATPEKHQLRLQLGYGNLISVPEFNSLIADIPLSVG